MHFDQRDQFTLQSEREHPDVIETIEHVTSVTEAYNCDQSIGLGAHRNTNGHEI